MKSNSIGIAGEVRCVVTKADGSIKADTGYQGNLILNQGLDFFGGNNGSYINDYCLIGSGNSVPAVSQTKLDAAVAIVRGTSATSDYSYVDKGDNLYRMWEQKQYRFTGLNNVNISEVGLASQGTLSSYFITTRTLIKDSAGSPTSITILAGETLDIYYKIHKVISISDKAFVINSLDGNGGAIPYNVIVRPINIGNSNSNSVSGPANKTLGNQDLLRAGFQDLSANNSEPSWSGNSNSIAFSPYVLGSYKLGFSGVFSLASINGTIRTVGTLNTIFPVQLRFGRVSDDAPLTKTNKDTLSIPLEISWGRYEGVL